MLLPAEKMDVKSGLKGLCTSGEVRTVAALSLIMCNDVGAQTRFKCRMGEKKCPR